MLATLQRRLLLILTIGLFLTLGVVAYTCRAALGYDRLNDQVQRTHEVKEELSAVLRLVVDAETGQRGAKSSWMQKEIAMRISRTIEKLLRHGSGERW
jgi:hypothetical protein